jgi:hypothetical protein
LISEAAASLPLAGVSGFSAKELKIAIQGREVDLVLFPIGVSDEASVGYIFF